jgi:hypothetical protein
MQYSGNEATEADGVPGEEGHKRADGVEEDLYRPKNRPLLKFAVA